LLEVNMLNRYNAVNYKSLGWSAVAVLLVASVAYAVPIIIDDVTSTTATNDGVVNVGEYVGLSTGINSGFGDVIGANSELHVDSDALGALNFGLVSGGGGLNDAAVIYLDTQPGGHSSTSVFTDNADGLRAAISGLGTGGGQSVLNFAAGFEADYAIAFEQNFAGVWELVAGASHNYITTANLNPAGNAGAGQWEMNLTLADIALNPGESFKYVVTYLNSGNAFRSDEFHGVQQATVPSGNPGNNPVTLATGDYNTFNSFQPIVPGDDLSWGKVKNLYR
jgi:hypothetical protein